MDFRRLGIHGLFRIEHRRQDFILDFNQLQRLAGGQRIHGSYGGDLLTHVHHLSPGQDFLIRRIPRRFHESVLDPQGVLDGDHRLDAGQCARL
jgi:hypothetical protein